MRPRVGRRSSTKVPSTSKMAAWGIRAPKGLPSANAALGRSVAERRRSSGKLLFVFSGTAGSVSLAPFADGAGVPTVVFPIAAADGLHRVLHASFTP